MDSLALAALIILFNFPHFYGAAENRLFLEHGEYLPGHHFKLYHLWLASLFAGRAFFVYVLSGSVVLAVCYLVYAPFGLDWVWWAIRYFDIKIRGHNDYDGGNGAPWHRKSDWDNYLGVPLVLGCYWWWYLCAIASAASLALFIVT